MAPTIYIETLESNAANPVDLVMLHGWAMHGGLMKGLAEKLSGQFRIHLVDLPGHGASTLNGSAFNLKQVAESVVSAVHNRISNKAVWLGWSLGGLVAMTIAEQYPESVSRLILLSATPAFVKQDDWLNAVDKKVFENFADELQNDLKATITRFLSLQVRGTEDSRQTLKQLREIVFSRDIASKDVLSQGLGVLEQTDLRNALQSLSMPSLLLGGERDTLIPQVALQQLANESKNIEASIIKKAGHAPFLSHPAQCAEAIAGFCHD